MYSDKVYAIKNYWVTEFMNEISNTLSDHESHPILLEYDIDDIRLSIQETVRAIEKFISDREVIKR